MLTGASTHKHARAKHTKTRDRPQLHTKRVSIYLIVSGSLFVVAVVDIVLCVYVCVTFFKVYFELFLSLYHVNTVV